MGLQAMQQQQQQLQLGGPMASAMMQHQMGNQNPLQSISNMLMSCLQTLAGNQQQQQPSQQPGQLPGQQPAQHRNHKAIFVPGPRITEVPAEENGEAGIAEEVETETPSYAASPAPGIGKTVRDDKTVKKKTVEDASSELEGLMEGKAKEKRIEKAAMALKEKKEQDKVAAVTKSKATKKVATKAAATKKPVISCELSRGQVKAWTGVHGEGNYGIFKITGKVESAKQQAAHWLVKECVKMGIEVQPAIKTMAKKLKSTFHVNCELLTWRGHMSRGIGMSL